MRVNTNRTVRRRGASRATAFTLIELLLVLVILAVLAAVVVPKFTGRAEQARIAAAHTGLTALETALDTFEVDAGRYPSTDEGLNALLNPPSGVKTWNGPYVKKQPVDPWGNAYVYRYPGQYNARGFDLASSGPDGQEGGADDITNWQSQ